MSCICVRVYQLNHIVLRLLIFYVYEFRTIQTRGEFNIYFRRSRDFFQSMVIPWEQISAFLFIGLWTLLSSFQVSKVSLSQTTGNGIED